MYRVEWEIDSEAETPLAAALEAFGHMQEPGTTATVFKVYDEGGNATTVDLEEEVEEPAPSRAEEAAKIVRRALVAAHNLDLDVYCRVMGTGMNDYSRDKWRLMQKDFAKWFSCLDSVSAKNFMKYSEKQC